MSKQTQIKALWEELASNIEVTELFKIRNNIKTNIGFVNHYKLHDFIPNKWFDWEKRLNAKVMIIGQDWGPYKALYPYIEQFQNESKEKNFDYEDFAFRTFSSRTEKFILKSLEKSFEEKFNKKMTNKDWNLFIFTVAVLFTRQGKHFRGNEFYDEKFGVKHSLPYLIKQIEIINPKIIIPLGGTAWGVLRNIYDLKEYPITISKVISELRYKPITTSDRTVIIPNFHPASHTDPKIQYRIWKTLWEFV